MIGIYKITNKNNGKVYIGQSNNIEKRLSEHKQKRTMTIDEYINILGVENFTFEVLEECALNELDIKEQQYIQKYNSQEDGYNIQKGGFNNSQGEGNGRAKLTEEDIIFIRQSYAQQVSPSKFYEQYFKDRITKSQFQGIWQGRSWNWIMPEVFTEENKRYYTIEQNKERAILNKEEILYYRKYYIKHTAHETYLLFIKEKGELLKEKTFTKILIGDINTKNSIYNDVPIYKKIKKCWELNGEPVSTILESEE